MKYLYTFFIGLFLLSSSLKAQSWQDCFLGAQTSEDFFNCLYGCFPFEADDECGAIHVCQDEKYSFCSCRGGILAGPYAYIIPTRVFSFDVRNVGQSVSIDLEGLSWNSSSITLVGPYTFESSCDNLEKVNPNNFINSSSNDPSGGSASLMNIGLTNDFGRYYIIYSGNGFYEWSNSNAQYPCEDMSLNITFSPEKQCVSSPCETCIGSFAPIPDGNYVIGTWVKEENAAPTKTSYTFPELSVVCQTNSGQQTFGPFLPQGEIIDGWQRIEEQINIPSDATNIQLVLASTSGNVFYDDVRMFPFEASMKSYVYDPVNMRLSAELDERHYATFYEYDEEGKLVRIKKETEKGIMTIQETKSNSAK